MDLQFDQVEPTTPKAVKAQVMLHSELDRVLTVQLVVAYAGESERLGWWRCDLVSEDGGKALFKDLLPHSWQWAVLQGARQAAILQERTLRKRDHAPDTILSLFGLGFELDEGLDERLLYLKHSGKAPAEALPELADMVTSEWNKQEFADWLDGQASAEHARVPLGRQVKDDPPAAIDQVIRRLANALLPLSTEYPVPHYRRKP